jgi:glycerol-3-phosphate cytidylyltransferase-like family protein
MKAQTADDILESKLWKDTMAKMRRVIAEQFAHTDPQDTLSLQKLAYQLQALMAIELDLRRTLRNHENA